MTNKEYYAEEILEIVTSGFGLAIAKNKPVACSNIVCQECECYYHDYNDCNSFNYIKEWANKEYSDAAFWSNVAVDTPIYVRDRASDTWHPRHFARYDNGGIVAWDQGKTSFTTTDTCTWAFAKLAEE